MGGEVGEIVPRLSSGRPMRRVISMVAPTELLNAIAFTVKAVDALVAVNVVELLATLKDVAERPETMLVALAVNVVVAESRNVTVFVIPVMFVSVPAT
jgi:hypothetical protein